MSLKGERVVGAAGNFMGGHLVKTLIYQGNGVVCAVDIKPLNDWYQTSDGVEDLSLDLKNLDHRMKAKQDADLVFQPLADMVGVGSIENDQALCTLSYA